MRLMRLQSSATPGKGCSQRQEEEEVMKETEKNGKENGGVLAKESTARIFYCTFENLICISNILFT